MTANNSEILSAISFRESFAEQIDMLMLSPYITRIDYIFEKDEVFNTHFSTSEIYPNEVRLYVSENKAPAFIYFKGSARLPEVIKLNVELSNCLVDAVNHNHKTFKLVYYPQKPEGSNMEILPNNSARYRWKTNTKFLELQQRLENIGQSITINLNDCESEHTTKQEKENLLDYCAEDLKLLDDIKKRVNNLYDRVGSVLSNRGNLRSKAFPKGKH